MGIFTGGDTIMTIARRPNRHNPDAPRLTFVAEVERCLRCKQPLSAKGSAAHSAKTVQTLKGEFYVVAYSRVCETPDCVCFGQHYHASGHLKVSLPYSTYGLGVLAQVGVQRSRHHKQFVEIAAGLKEQGVAINDKSVGRLYRQFLALVSGAWPQREARLQAAAKKYGGLVMLVDGLAPNGEGPQLYVIWEALSGTPVSGLLLDKADTPHVTKWMEECKKLLVNLPVLATMCDGEGALLTGLETVWSDAAHGLCQSHYLSNLAKPVEEDDRGLKEELQTQLFKLVGVPTLTPEEAETRRKPFVVSSEAASTESEPSPDTEQPLRPTVRAGSRFANLLFSSPASADAETANEQEARVGQMERYYGYYRRAVRDALTRSSRKPLQYGGLQGYDQLVGINQALLQRREKWGTDPYLDALQQRVQSAVTAAQTQAASIHQAKDCLVEVERCLAQSPLPSLDTPPEPSPSSPRSQIVARKLKQIFDDLAQQPDLSSTSLRLIEKWKRMKKKWVPGILHCYDTPGLPRHNLKLEGLFGTLRRNERRVSGRKETSPLRIFGPGELMLTALKEHEVLPLLQSVSTQTYWTERRKQEEREEPRRWLRRLRQNPVRALAQVDQQLYSIVNEPARASP